MGIGCSIYCISIIYLEWPEGGDQNVEPHVELLAAHEERIVDVAGDDVGLLHQVRVEHSLALPRPLLQLGQLVDEEDARALRLPARLHDPGGVGVLAVLLHKHVVVRGQDEGRGDEVQIQVATLGALLGQGVALPLEVAAVPLDVLHHGVLPRQLVVVGEMVDQLKVIHSVARVNREKVPAIDIV